MTRVAAALCLAVLAGCVIGPTRKQVLDGMIGKSETELVRRLGVPTRSFDTGGRHFLAYVQQNSVFIDGGYGGFGPGLGFGGFYGGGFGGFGGGFPSEIVQDSCETTIEVEQGIVRGWGLHGDGCS